jgi:hypothetical protein
MNGYQCPKRHGHCDRRHLHLRQDFSLTRLRTGETDIIPKRGEETMKTKCTTDNIEQVRETVAALDQRAELVAGCETWAIYYDGGQRRQMTVWPDARGAVCWGADSQWGDWRGGHLHLDSGEIVNDCSTGSAGSSRGNT